MKTYTKSELNKLSKEELVCIYKEVTTSVAHSKMTKEELKDSILDALRFQNKCLMLENMKKYGHVFENLDDLSNLSKEYVEDAYMLEFNALPPKSFTKKRMIEDVKRLRDSIIRSKAIRSYRSK